MDDDDYGADEELLAAMAATAEPTVTPSRPQHVQQPTPQRVTTIQQPKPQRLDRPPPPGANVSGNSSRAVQQPAPQALPQKQSGSTILVSPRQRGNPVLTSIRSMPWEYSDIPADYVMGLTTCALFLSLKYHRLHPEYIYTRIRNLQGKYNLRILLTLVDIPNHEDSLRELSKTSMVNNVTVMLCWSAAEVARYIELYKSYENANFNAIRGQQPSTYADKLVDFVTVPRSLNKSDAVALVANFGSLKNAINADPEHLSMVSGWGGVKVKRWSKAMEEPFRTRNAAKRGLKPASSSKESMIGQGDSRPSRLDHAVPISRVPAREMSSFTPSSRDSLSKSTPVAGTPNPSTARQFQFLGDDDDNDADEQEAALLATAMEESAREHRERVDATETSTGEKTSSQGLSGGVAAALAKLRENG